MVTNKNPYNERKKLKKKGKKKIKSPLSYASGVHPAALQGGSGNPDSLEARSEKASSISVHSYSSGTLEHGLCVPGSAHSPSTFSSALDLEVPAIELKSSVLNQFPSVLTWH